MARPQDWSALGMHSDPTPGDVDTLSSLYQGLRDTETLGNEITSGLNRVLDQSGNGFVGRTAEAVRAKIDGHLKQFIDAIGQSFSVAADATMAFKTTLQDVQMKADDALRNAQGLSKDDPQLNGLKAQAHTAQDEYNTAVRTYEHRMKDAQHLIRQPIDAWHLFLKSLGILEIILAIVGAFFGGWIGMLAFGLGMVVFISTLVDFAEGKAGLLDVALAFIGILFPSTKGINVGGLTKSVFNALKNLPKTIGSGLTGLGGALSHILTGGLSFRGIYSGVTALPGLVLRGLNGVANLAIKGLKITIAGLKMLAQTFRADFQMATAGIHTTFGKVGVYAISFGSRFVLSATLPVDFFELGIHAGSAFKMGFGTRLLTPTAHLSQSALGGGLHIGALTADHGGLAGFTGGMPHFETFQPGTLQGFNPGGLQGLNTGLGGAQLGGLHGITVGADVGGANLGSLHSLDLGAHPGTGDNLLMANAGGLDSVEHLTAFDHFTGFQRTSAGLLEPLPTHMGGVDLSGAHGLSGLGSGTHALRSDLGISGTGTGLNTALGDALNSVRVATGHVEDFHALGIPELRSIVDGDISNIRMTQDGISLQVGAHSGTPTTLHMDYRGTGGLTNADGKQVVVAPEVHEVLSAAGVDVKAGAAVDVKAGAVDIKAGAVDVRTGAVDVKVGAVDVKAGAAADVKAGGVDVKVGAVDVKASAAADIKAGSAPGAPSASGIKISRTDTAAGHSADGGTKDAVHELDHLSGGATSLNSPARPSRLTEEPPNPSLTAQTDHLGVSARENLDLLGQRKGTGDTAGTFAPSAIQSGTHVAPRPDQVGPDAVVVGEHIALRPSSAPTPQSRPHSDGGRPGPLSKFEAVTGGAAGKTGADRLAAWNEYEQAQVDLADAARQLDLSGGKLGRPSETVDEAGAKQSLQHAEISLDIAKGKMGRLGMDAETIGSHLDALGIPGPGRSPHGHGPGVAPNAPKRRGQQNAAASSSAGPVPPATKGELTRLTDPVRFSPQFREHAASYKLTPVMQYDGMAKGALRPGEEIRFIATVPSTSDVEFKVKDPATGAVVTKNKLFELAKTYEKAFGADSGRGERLGLVIGVNGRPGDEAVIEKAIKGFAEKWDKEGTYSVSVTGFTWKQGDPKLVAAGTQKEIPYGAIREAIVRDDLTQQMLTKAGADGPVYLHIGDADVKDMTVGGKPLLDTATKVINDMKVTTVHEQTLFPEVVSGGYKLTDTAAATKAADLDLAVRDAMNAVDPRAVYFPEPNTFLRVDTANHEGLEAQIHFGIKQDDKWRFEAQEGKHLLKNVIAARENMWEGDLTKMVQFRSDLALVTDGGRIAKDLPDDLKSLMGGLTQSHADKKVWTDQVTDYLQTHHAGLLGADPNAARTLADLAFHDIRTDGSELVRLEGPALVKAHEKDMRSLVQASKSLHMQAAAKDLVKMAVNTRNVLVTEINKLNKLAAHGVAPSAPGAVAKAVTDGHFGDAVAHAGGDLASHGSWKAARDAAVPKTVRNRDWTDPISHPGRAKPFSGPIRDNAKFTRYVVKAGFDIRTFTVDGHAVSDLTIRVKLADDGVPKADADALWQRASSGVDKLFNQPGHVLPDGSVLHVTLERAEGPLGGHLTVTAGEAGSGANQYHWPLDASETDLAHELGHQLGLRDEYRAADAGHRPDNKAGLMGDYTEGLNGSAVRSWHLQMLQQTLDAYADTGHALTAPLPPHSVDLTPAPGPGKAKKQTAAPPPPDPWTSHADPGRFGSNSDFKQAYEYYELKPVAQYNGAAKGALKPGDDLRFVATVPVKVEAKDDLLLDVAKKYGESFGAGQGWNERLGLVIGLNGRAGKHDLILTKIQEFAKKWEQEGTFSVSVTGFTWRQPDPKKITAGHGEQKEVPYGAIREAIIRDDLTRDMINNLRPAGESEGQLYLHIGDSDVQDFVVDNRPLFDRAVTAIEGAKFTYKSDGSVHYPEAISGGYKLPAGTTEKSLAGMKAADLDLAVRGAMGTVDSRAIYFPEPNTFVRVDTAAYDTLDDGIHFGAVDKSKVGGKNHNAFSFEAQEGQHLLDNLIKSRQITNPAWLEHPAHMVKFDPELALVTDGGRIADKMSADPQKLMSGLTQSHAHPGTWKKQMEHYLTLHHPGVADQKGMLDILHKLAFHEIVSDGSKLTRMDGATLIKQVLSPAEFKLLKGHPDLGKFAVRTRTALVEHLNKLNQHGEHAAVPNAPTSKKVKASAADKAEKAAKFEAKKPDERLQKLLFQNGYATGDQFGVAAALHSDPKLHVLLIRNPLDHRDRSQDIRDFYVASGIDADRISVREVKEGENANKLRLNHWREINDPVLSSGGTAPGSRQMDEYVVSVSAATTWVGKRFGPELRDDLRAAWQLDDAHFTPQLQEAVGDWLKSRGVPDVAGRDVVVLWTRFSGKRGEIHVEHDTSHTGVRQILEGLHHRTADRPQSPLVIIAGDASAHSGRPSKFPGIASDFRAMGLDVHDLTAFWKNPEGLHTWGGDTRIGQMRLFEYLNRAGDGRLKHLGFRSGNLEAMALSGHQVRYLEEPGSAGGERMAKWHEIPGTGRTEGNGMAPGYERLVIEHPPTRSGQITVEVRELKHAMKAAYDGKGKLPSHIQAELNDLTHAYEHPGWVPGGGDRPYVRNLKPVAAHHTKGFAESDVHRIVDYLTAPRPGEALDTSPHAPTAGRPEVSTVDHAASPEPAQATEAAGSKTPEAPPAPQAPPRMTGTGQIGGADRVLPSQEAAANVTRDLVAHFDDALTPPQRDTLRADLQAQLGREIWPSLSAMTRGETRTLTVDVAGFSGDITVRAEVTKAEPDGAFKSLEFEDGSESLVRDGFQRETRSVVTAGVLVKGKAAAQTDLTGHLSSNWSRTESHRMTSSGRLFSRTKTPEPALKLDVEVRLEFDVSAMSGPSGKHLARPGASAGRVEVSAKVPVAVAEADVRPSADMQHYLPPARVEQTLALGGMDTVRDLFLVDADGMRVSGSLHKALLGSGADPHSLEAYGKRVFGDRWPAVRELVLDRIGSLDSLQYRLKGMTSGEALEIDLGPDAGSLLVTAEVTTMKHLRNTDKTEFNTGSDVTRVYTHTRSSEHGVRATMQAQSADLHAGPTTVTGVGHGEFDRDGALTVQESVRTGTAVKMKVPGAVFDGVATLSFVHRADPLGADSTPGVGRAPHPPGGQARLGFQVLMDAADARPVSEPGVFSAATRPQGPRRMTAPALQEGDHAWRPAPGVWDGLPSHAVVLDVLSGEERALGAAHSPRLADLVDGAGRAHFGADWADVRPAAHDMATREQLAATLPQLTRGTVARSTPLPTPLRSNAQLSLSGRLESLEYVRTLDAAEINLLSDVADETGGRLGSALGHGQLAQGGVQPELGSDFTLAVHAPGGGIAHRARTADGVSGGHSSVAAAKYPEPMTVYIATVGVDAHIGRVGESATHGGRTDVRFVVALPKSHTQRYEITAEGVGSQVFHRPDTVTPAPPARAGAGLSVRPPLRVSDSGRIGNGDAVLELPGDQVIKELRRQLADPFGERWDQVEGEVAQYFDSIALQPRTAGLTAGDTWGGSFRAGPVTADIRITAADARMTEYLRVEKDFEFEQGTESAAAASVQKDSHVRRTLWERAGFKAPHVTVTLGHVRHKESVAGHGTDVRGGVVAKNKTVEPAAVFKGEVTYTVEVKISHALPGRGDERTFTVTNDGEFAFPVRDLPADPATGVALRPEQYRRVPDRIADSLRLGAEDVVLDTRPVRGDAAGTRIVEDVLRQLDPNGPKLFGSAADWKTARAKLAERLPASEFQRRLKSMMAGQPWVVRVNGRELAIRASVKEMTHTADTKATEFNSATVGGTGGGRTESGPNGPQITSDGTNVTVVGTSDPIGGSPAEVFGGGTLAHTTQSEHLADSSSGIRSAAGTKTKVPGSVYDGVARLHFEVRDRWRPFGRGVDTRVSKDAIDKQTRFKELRENVAGRQRALDEASAAGRPQHEIDALTTRLDTARASFDEALTEQSTRIRDAVDTRRTGQGTLGFAPMTKWAFGVRVRSVGEAEIGFQALLPSADTVRVAAPDRARFTAPELGVGRPQPPKRPGVPPTQVEVPRPPESLLTHGMSDGQLVRDLPDVQSLRGLLDSEGGRVFGSAWSEVTRTGQRRGELVMGGFTRDRLMAALPELTRGGELRGESFRVNGREAWVSVRADLLGLTHARPEPRAEVALATEKTYVFGRRDLHSRQFFLLGQVGAVAGTLESKLGAAVTFGGGFRRRTRGDQFTGGRTFTNAKIPTPLQHYDGHVEFTFTFHHGGTRTEASGVVAVGVSVPSAQITERVVVDQGHVFTRPTEQTAARPLDKGKQPAEFTVDEHEAIDAGAALSDARRLRADAERVLSELNERQDTGVGGVADGDGTRRALAQAQLERAEAAEILAEAHWSEVTGGRPLPFAVSREGAAVPGLGGGAAHWSRSPRGGVPSGSKAPEGSVVSVEHIPSASHVVFDTDDGEAYALVPSGPDLTVAHWVSDPASAHGRPADAATGQEAHVGDIVVQRQLLDQALTAAEGTPQLKKVLERRATSFEEDVRLFRVLEERTSLRELAPAQLAAVVLAERRALRTLSADWDRLTDNLLSARGSWRWVRSYPLDEENLGPVVQRVHRHLLADLSLTVNIDLGARVGDGTLLDAMTGGERLLRNVWEVVPGYSRYFERRGAAEEAMGYPASVKRTTHAAGIYPPKPGLDAWDESFAPTPADRADLPNYAALTSQHRPRGLGLYGNAVFHLKRELLERATFTPGDSFSPGRQGARSITGSGNLLPLLNHGPDRLVRLAFAEATGFRYDEEFRLLRDTGQLERHLVGFFEAQLHGGVRWEDVERVVLVREGGTPAHQQQARLEQFAQEAGHGFTVEILEPGAVRPTALAPDTPAGNGTLVSAHTNAPGDMFAAHTSVVDPTPARDKVATETHATVEEEAVPVRAPETAVPAHPDPAEAFEAVRQQFPDALVHTGRWTMWGHDGDTPHTSAYAIESGSLGLRGVFTPPAADGGVGAWHWELPGHQGPVAVTPLKLPTSAHHTAPAPTPITADAADPLMSQLAAAPWSAGLHWRADDEELYVFGPAGAEHPAAAFADGLRPPGGHLVHVAAHAGADDPQDSAWLTATRTIDWLRAQATADPSRAEALLAHYGWRYDVAAPGGVDVTATLDLAAPHPERAEVLYPGGVDGRHIRGAQRLEGGRPVGRYVTNPGFVEPGTHPTPTEGTET
ncbi:scabin-related ADP-ribosyltransferase [Streptomyces justiciae]|uniref:scabin-related ADP-ribosyltransferase n=1 Tax=Streptomyces justiciae TaxID=2780140 RepID=UPI00211955D3|nr:hypothetical protein [Streptomyces justiciae]MCW8383738.1 hypothetical protein [Streptomyces justiciae]